MQAFDPFTDLYDLLTDWGGRLDREIPFLHRTLEEHGAKRILDAACGTGIHLRSLAHLGFEIAGSDISPEMVGLTSERLSGITGARFQVAGFSEAGDRFCDRDAVLVIGNSLPNAGSAGAVRDSLEGLGRALREGGVLILHMLNFEKLVREGGGLRPHRRVEQDGREYLFLKLFEVRPDEVVLLVIALIRENGVIRQRMLRSVLYPIREPWLAAALAELGFDVLAEHGDFDGRAFDEANSGDLIVVARKTGGGR